MSWLVANWIGGIAVFAAPAVAGIMGWMVVVRTRQTAERFARERAFRRHAPLSPGRQAHPH